MPDKKKRAMDAEKKSTRGGRRKGAGRKPRETPLEAITVKVEPEHAARFREICEFVLVENEKTPITS